MAIKGKRGLISQLISSRIVKVMGFLGDKKNE